MMNRDLLAEQAKQSKVEIEAWEAKKKEAAARAMSSSGDDWICDYWKSIYDDFKEAHDFWRAEYDEWGCSVPHDTPCTYINSKIIGYTQQMNLTKQLADDDGCDTSGW